MRRAHAALLASALQLMIVVPAGTDAPSSISTVPSREAPVNSTDVFQHPLPAWSSHCLGFGSAWRYCNGVALRACASGAVWMHTGVDVRAGVGEPVAAAGDGVIAGYLVDAQFRGGVLIRHRTTAGAYITQYWHVWLNPGFHVGSPVKRGQAFASIADMGSRTHFHFAVFKGDFDSHAWNGALPPAACSGFPAFPYRFVDPNAFFDAHQAPVRFARGTRL